MKKTTRTLSLITALLFTALFGLIGFSVVDAAFEMGGELAKFWPVLPLVKLTVEFLPFNIIQRLPGHLYAEATAIVFAKDIEENIYPANEFYKQSTDDTPFIESEGNGSVVRKGVAGAKPSVSIDRSSLPATISKRTDDSDDYSIAEFTTDPSLIQVTEDLILRYDKRMSLLQNHIDTINTKVADYLANKWLPDGASNIVRSSGTATRTASAPSAAGTRKRVIKDDVIKVAEIMNRMDAPANGRFMLIPAEFLSDMLSIDDFVHADKLGSRSNLVEGSIGRILGFDVFMRSSTGVYDNTATPVKKALGASGAATDNLAALFWYRGWVNRAEGNAKVFLDEDKPEYYGSIMSAMVRAGGKIRKDKKGVVALVEAA
ncbi:MAG: hypothetical protein GC192_23455 [Bacteroidetes bacterium]|nr:hypothetical protein [Bacteroidota bacterium]